MVRMIRFRGRDLTGAWIYGDVHFGVDNKSAHIHPKKGRNLSVDVDPETVGQFIGRCDRNKNDIYEGCSVRIKSQYETDDPVDSIAKVIYRDGSFRLTFHDMIINRNIAESVGNWGIEVLSDEKTEEV